MKTLLYRWLAKNAVSVTAAIYMKVVRPPVPLLSVLSKIPTAVCTQPASAARGPVAESCLHLPACAVLVCMQTNCKCYVAVEESPASRHRARSRGACRILQSNKQAAGKVWH